MVATVQVQRRNTRSIIATCHHQLCGSSSAEGREKEEAAAEFIPPPALTANHLNDCHTRGMEVHHLQSFYKPSESSDNLRFYIAASMLYQLGRMVASAPPPPPPPYVTL